MIICTKEVAPFRTIIYPLVKLTIFCSPVAVMIHSALSLDQSRASLPPIRPDCVIAQHHSPQISKLINCFRCKNETQSSIKKRETWGFNLRL